ncbi:MAG: hypothetical protein R3C71_07075 [Candidatus Krumholzibacteriia bacterium]|nr:hypothetical protein [bacterium]MCB9517169.1 hypothetical protein [Candidatus Latescibacterota bacterium]
MRKTILLALAALAIAGALPQRATAGEEILYQPRPLPVWGKQSRADLRHSLYAKRLPGDKLVVFEEHGFTPFRLREDRGVAGVTERWRYPALGLEFRFDENGRLIERRRVPKGDRSFD